MNSLALNQTRVSYAYGADYVGAEEMLGQITGIRNEAENRIRQALKEKHQREVRRTFKSLSTEILCIYSTYCSTTDIINNELI